MSAAPEQQVIEYVGEHEGVSFVELEELLSDSIEVDGEVAITAPADPKINFWVNVSEQFYQVVRNVLDTEQVYLHPCEPVVYAVDGKMPKADLAKEPPEGGYATERWFPVAFCSYPIEEREDHEEDEA